MRLKSTLPDLRRDPTLPTSFWDPRWQEPAVAARIAADAYRQLSETEAFAERPLLADAEVPALAPKHTERRTFALGAPAPVDGVTAAFRGGSFGEIFRRYTYGGARPSVNFHAQAVIFGADVEGRYFLRATVGRFDGGWGNRATLAARFIASGAPVGALLWSGELDPPDNREVLLAGRCESMASAFPNLDAVEIAFFTQPG